MKKDNLDNSLSIQDTNIPNKPTPEQNKPIESIVETEKNLLML